MMMMSIVVCEHDFGKLAHCYISIKPRNNEKLPNQLKIIKKFKKIEIMKRKKVRNCSSASAVHTGGHLKTLKFMASI